MRGRAFPAITRRINASAEPRYRAGSLPSAVYPERVARITDDSNTALGSGNCKIFCSHSRSSCSSAAEVAFVCTLDVRQPKAMRGHFVFSAGSIETFFMRQWKYIRPRREGENEKRARVVVL